MRIPPIESNAVGRVPVGLAGAIGCYHWGTRSVFVLNKDACAKAWGGEEFFRVPNRDEIYKSFLVHEVAHSVAAANFSIEHPTTTVQEYIAAVAQLSVMEEWQRADILSRFQGDGFDPPGEISLFAYQMDPARFIVECYRRHLRPENGRRFIRQLLSGRVVLSDYASY